MQMDGLRVTLDLKVFEEQPGCSESVTELPDERLRYNYVELIYQNSEDLADKIKRMRVFAMIGFLNDYLKKHPEVYNKDNFPYVLLPREEYERMKWGV